MRKQRQCPRCGAYLDAEELCDCEKEVKTMKTAKRILIGIMALGLLGAFCIISTCDYEDYCKNHGVECETETNPLTALIPAAVVALAGAGVAYIERKEDANNDR